MVLGHSVLEVKESDGGAQSAPTHLVLLTRDRRRSGPKLWDRRHAKTHWLPKAQKLAARGLPLTHGAAAAAPRLQQLLRPPPL